MWTVGALARATGLTVRTLHHWDEIGLLAPAERSEAGYRRYGRAELERVYAIVALRRLGLSLEEVHRWLDGGGDLGGAVAAQLDHVDAQIESARELRARLLAVRAALDGGEDGGLTSNELIDLIEVTRMHEQHYTPEQREQLAARAAELGEDGLRDAEAQWAELIAEAQKLRAEGADPAGARVQELVRRWNAMIEAFTGGDPGIRASLQRMYDEQGPERASRGAVDPALMAWMATARAAR